LPPLREHLAAGRPRRYGLSLRAGQYLQLAVEQLGVDIVAELRDPAGNLLLRVDSPTGEKGAEDLFLVAGTTGRHVLEIDAYEGSGEYEIRIESLRDEATADDRKRAAAASALSRARLLKGERGSEGAAAASYQRAASLWGKLGEDSRAAWALKSLGMLYSGVPTHRREAADAFSRALGLFQRVHDQRQQALVLGSLAKLQAVMGDYERAGRLQEQALALWQRLDDTEEQAARLNDLAIVRVRQGRMHDAIDLYTRSAAICRRRGEWAKVATIDTNLGVLYSRLGESRMALDGYRQALALLDRQPDSARKAVVLTKLGDVLLRTDGPAPALEQYHKAQELRRRQHDTRGEAVTLNSIGLAQLKANQPGEAFQAFSAALRIFQEENDAQNQATVLGNLGLVFERLGHPRRAGEQYEKALARARESSNLQPQEDALFGLARVTRAEGRLDEAEARIEEALGLIEAARGRVGRLDLQASYQAGRQAQYGFLIDLLAERHRREPDGGYEARAFAVSERARARSLLDLLSFSRDPVDPAELRRLDELSRRINRRDLDLLAASSRGLASDRGGDPELTALLEGFRQAKAGPGEPRHPRPSAPPLASLSRVQSTILDPETLLLEYFLGEERSFLWAVTPSEARFVTGLPGRKQIEQAARQTYDRMTESHLQTGEAPARLAAAKLSRMILGPVADLLGRRRLVIVAPGALQIVPFAALPAPGAADPLILDHEIVSLPSVSVLAALRSHLAGRRPPHGLLAVLADPVLGPDDERLPSPAATPAADRRLPRLPYTGDEASAILALAGSAPVLAASGFAASRELVRSGRLAHYRILHFATHGLANDLYPELSALSLSAFAPSGRPVDGQLRAYEISDLTLRADLVVLSACRTALGEAVGGEGLVGLTQAFLHAGAARLVVSLWDVNDRATVELMQRFYSALLREKLPPSQALRQAQISLLQQDRWHAPYYWAGFVLQGEWK
jgi:CHAT domain-containing protein/tetratricopeptide (TPR) repeat protein